MGAKLHEIADVAAQLHTGLPDGRLVRMRGVGVKAGRNPTGGSTVGADSDYGSYRYVAGVQTMRSSRGTEATRRLKSMDNDL